MKRLVPVAMVAVLGALALTLAACKTDKPQPTPAPSDSSSNNDMWKIDDGDVPVAPDYEEEALKAVTPENVEAEVAKMEKEIDSQ